jgi:hypothetical protein
LPRPQRKVNWKSNNWKDQFVTRSQSPKRKTT